MRQAKEVFESIVKELELTYPDLAITHRWGRSQLLLNKKMFATFSQNDMSFKLEGKVLEQAYGIDDACPWNPIGKPNPSRSWVQIPSPQQKHWLELSLAAALIARSP